MFRAQLWCPWLLIYEIESKKACAWVAKPYTEDITWNHKQDQSKIKTSFSAHCSSANRVYCPSVIRQHTDSAELEISQLRFPAKAGTGAKTFYLKYCDRIEWNFKWNNNDSTLNCLFNLCKRFMTRLGLPSPGQLLAPQNRHLHGTHPLRLPRSHIRHPGHHSLQRPSTRHLHLHLLQLENFNINAEVIQKLKWKCTSRRKLKAAHKKIKGPHRNFVTKVPVEPTKVNCFFNAASTQIT